jgi:hypothetical protein
VSAEPGRPCPACRHATARADGPVAGAATYLCGFCEAVVHARPDGTEAVSYRVHGERREFHLMGDRLLRFPLPGAGPEDVVVPVREALLAAAPGAGHPATLPGHPVTAPAHPVAVPAAPVGLGAHPTTPPGHPVGRPDHPVVLPAPATTIPDHPVARPAHPTVPHRSAPVRLPGHPAFLPGHALGRPGHPLGGVAVARAEAADGACAARTVRVIVVPPEPSRFSTRTPMPSVLRGSR